MKERESNGSASGDDRLEQVRELLFGSASRSLERTISKVAADVQRRLGELETRVDGLDKRVDKELAELRNNKQIQEKLERLEATNQELREAKADASEIADMFTELARRLHGKSTAKSAK